MGFLLDRFSLLTLIVSFLFAIFGYSQEKELTDKQTEFIYSITYDMNRDLFVTPKYAYKKEPLDFDQKLVKTSNSIEVINSSIDSLLENSKLKVEKGAFGYNLILESKFPSYFTEEFPSSVIDIEINESKLNASANKRINISKTGSINFGSKRFYTNYDGKEVNLNFITLYKQNQIKEDAKILDPITGWVSYNLKVVTDYDTLKISNKDIGRKFDFLNNQFNIINIFDNKLILNCLTEEASNLPDFNIINLSEDGENELKAYSLFEIQELKEKDAAYAEVNSFAGGRMTIGKNIYELFNANKNISLEEFKQLFPIDAIKNTKNTEKYIVLYSPAPFENEIILYAPRYGVDRELMFEYKY